MRRAFQSAEAVGAKALRSEQSAPGALRRTVWPQGDMKGA